MSNEKENPLDIVPEDETVVPWYRRIDVRKVARVAGAASAVTLVAAGAYKIGRSTGTEETLEDYVLPEPNQDNSTEE